MRSQRPKTFVTPGSLRYGRWPGGGGQLIPVFKPWPTGPALPPLVFDEKWNYTPGNFPTTAAANWTGFNPVAPGNNLNLTVTNDRYVVKNTTLSGFAVLSSGLTIPTVNPSHDVAISAIVHSFEPGIGAGNPSTATFDINPGNPWGFQLSADTVAGTSWLHQSPGGTTHTGIIANISTDVTFLLIGNVAAQTSKLYINGVLTDTITGVTIPGTAAVGLSLITNTAGVANAVNQSFGELKLYGSA